MKKLLIILIILVALAGCTQVQQEPQITTPQVDFTVQAVNLDGEIVFGQGVRALEGSMVFDALIEDEVPIEYEISTYGAFVTGVGTLVPEAGEYIGLYVNGEYASVGISELEVEDGMILEFRIETIDEAFQE